MFPNGGNNNGGMNMGNGGGFGGANMNIPPGMNPALVQQMMSKMQSKGMNVPANMSNMVNSMGGGGGGMNMGNNMGLKGGGGSFDKSMGGGGGKSGGAYGPVGSMPPGGAGPGGKANLTVGMPRRGVGGNGVGGPRLQLDAIVSSPNDDDMQSHTSSSSSKIGISIWVCRFFVFVQFYIFNSKRTIFIRFVAIIRPTVQRVQNLYTSFHFQIEAAMVSCLTACRGRRRPAAATWNLLAWAASPGRRAAPQATASRTRHRL